MKLKSFLFAAMAVTALASCSDDNEIVNSGDNPVDNVNAKGYMALHLDMPKASLSRATHDAQGSKEETKITNALIVFLKEDKTKEDKTVESTYTLTAPDNTLSSEAFEVTGTPQTFIVIANFTQEILTLCTKGTALTNIKSKVLENTDIVQIASEGKFLMTTLEEVSCAGHIKTVSPMGPFYSKEAAKSAAVSDPAIAYVDRVVSKITLKNALAAKNANEATVVVKKWGLDVTNTKYFLMPDKEIDVITSDYFIDPNYNNNVEEKRSDFSRMSVTDLDNFQDGASKYCLENTMTAKQQVNAYTTQILLQAEYTPKGYTKGTSWFRFRGKSYASLTDLQIAYNNDAPAQLKSACDVFFTKMKAKDATHITASKFSLLTIDMLDAVEDGGSVSQDIEYYQKGLCYYPILIRHDSAITTPMALGRWGVVRNNWYTITIKSITEPGTPWVETPGIDDPLTGDPTDPNIADIENADDITKSYIAVTIDVRNWISWQQNVDL